MQRTLLLIDDDPDDYRLIHDCLLQVGMSSPIHFEIGGKEAFEYLEKNINNLPILVILDVNLPQMSGMEVLETIRKKYHIPVIMYTTSCTDEIIQKSKILGAIDCVKKGTSYVDNLRFAKRVVEMMKK